MFFSFTPEIYAKKSLTSGWFFFFINRLSFTASRNKISFTGYQQPLCNAFYCISLSFILKALHGCWWRTCHSILCLLLNAVTDWFFILWLLHESLQWPDEQSAHKERFISCLHFIFHILLDHEPAFIFLSLYFTSRLFGSKY